MALPHVPLLGLGVAEGNEALETLQTVMLICTTKRKRSQLTADDAVTQGDAVHLGAKQDGESQCPMLS